MANIPFNHIENINLLKKCLKILKNLIFSNIYDAIVGLFFFMFLFILPFFLNKNQFPENSLKIVAKYNILPNWNQF